MIDVCVPFDVLYDFLCLGWKAPLFGVSQGLIAVYWFDDAAPEYPVGYVT